MNEVSAGRKCLVGLLVAVTAAARRDRLRARPTPGSARSVVESKQLQLFTLAVPTEKENADHDEGRAHAARRASRSTRSCPPPAGSAQVQQTGSGEDAVIQKVTWTGGSVPTGEDALVPVPRRRRRREQDLHLRGPADVLRRLGGRLDRPRELRHARADDRGEELARRRRRSSTLAIVALILGGARARRSAIVGLLVAGREAARWHDRSRPAVTLLVAAGRGARAAGRGVGARRARCARCPRRAGSVNSPPEQVALTYSEAVEPRFAIVSVTDAAGAPGDDRAAAAVAGRRRHARRPAEEARRGLVPRLLARDLGRRPPGARRVHVRGRPEPRARRRSS